MGAIALAVAGLLTLNACTTPDSSSDTSTLATYTEWNEVLADADGQTVDLWMWGGDEQGNAYVDNVLTPAAAERGVTLNRVPIADTGEALNRMLSEVQAGRTDDGSVDLVWVNGDNFRTGREANAWLCEWTSLLPNMELVSSADPLLTEDFGTPVNGCEAPWNKAQFTFAYNSDVVTDPPTTVAGLLEWAEDHPGRFTYPAPPDFTGSAFLRHVLYSVSGGYENVPAEYTEADFVDLTPELYDTLAGVAPFLWRGGDTYPADSDQLNSLYADGQVDFTMTYGPATLTQLVEDGTYPAATKVLSLEDGTLGNASFLAIPANAADAAGAMVVTDTALSVEQQVAKADPATWGQFTVVDYDKLSENDLSAFKALPESPVVPSFDVLSTDANPELAAEWVPALDEGWRTSIPAGR
ncbi:ABC transporter substrate-binding protein [Demequina flava]|uniref:ABC transporter substrate-binding protein n=1 Tax=Demequina flava TaxID=1095025 RepID=UPI00078673AE|nr:ABC transporter substrate-binding protein [Demequina flava]